MAKFVPNGVLYPQAYTMFGQKRPENASPYMNTMLQGAQIAVQTHAMACCGLGTLSGFYGAVTDPTSRESEFAKEAEYIQDLYAHYRNPGHFVYVLTNSQLSLDTHGNTVANNGYNAVPQLHKMLVKCGSREIAKFPNLNHGPHILYMFLVNIRDAIGVYLDENGRALKEPPKPKPVEPPVVILAEPILDEKPKRVRKPKEL